MAITTIDYSIIESETLGLKIGRCNTDYFDEQELYTLITGGAYDLCRVKVCAEDEFASMRLSRTGLPAFFSGSIRRYKTRISVRPEGTYNYADLEWIEYDGSQQQLLKDMLAGTWGTYPIGYYRTPYLHQLVTKEQEIESVFRFYKKHNDPHENPNNTIVFIKHQGNYVGFFALNKVNGNLESHVGGILEPYRSGGYFLDKLRYIKEYCIEHGLTHFIFGARNENSRVQKIFQHVGFEAVGSENVFHIPSLLSYAASEAVTIDIKVANKQDAFMKVFAQALSIAENKMPSYSRTSFRLNEFSAGPGEKISLLYHIPVHRPEEVLVVIREAGTPPGGMTGYLRAYQ